MSDTALYLLVFFIWSFMGFILIGVGIHTRKYQRKKEAQERATAPGRVVEVVTKVNTTPRAKSVRYYVPVIEFTVSGRVYRLENENGSGKIGEYQPGMPVSVLYDQDHPTHFHLAEDGANMKSSASAIKWGIIWVIGAAALTFLCIQFHLLR